MKFLSVFIKFICTILTLQLMTLISLELTFDFYSFSISNYKLKILSIIVLKMLFILVALIQMFSIYYKRVDVTKVIIISAVFMVLGIFMSFLHSDNIRFILIVLLICIADILSKKYFK